MRRRFEVRKEELLAECAVPPELFARLQARLRAFVEPFAQCLHQQQVQHAQTYIAGLLSDLQRKNAEAIAYRFDQEREGLQHFLGTAPWQHQPLLDILVSQVDQEIGRVNAVLVFDPSAFPKKGTASVGVARQWCGRLGKVENCQVGIYLGYVSSSEHTLVDFRLYLSKEWTPDRKRCLRAGVPKEQIRYRTRHQLALEMLDERGEQLPHAWVAGDDEMGRSSWFRGQLRDRQEQYLLAAVPCNTTIRDLQAPCRSTRAAAESANVPSSRCRCGPRICLRRPGFAWRCVRERKGPWSWRSWPGGCWRGRREGGLVPKNCWW